MTRLNTSLDDRITRTLEAVADETVTSDDALRQLADRHGRRRRWRRGLAAAGSFAAAAAALLLLIVAAQPRGQLIPGIEPADDPAPTAAGETAPAAAPADGSWETLDLDAALGRLIDNAAAADPVPTAGPGQVQIERVARAVPRSEPEPDAPTTRPSPDGDTAGRAVVPDHTEIAVTEYRWQADGSRVDRRAVIASLPFPASAEDMRHAYAEADVPVPLQESGRYGAEELGGPEPSYYEQAITDAEEKVEGPHEPAPERTERPAQAAAFIRTADALREAVTPAQHVRALELLGRIHHSLIEYRGPVTTLDGTYGVGIAGYDRANTTWTTLILDPGTGRLIGTVREFREIPESLAEALTVGGTQPETPLVYELSARDITVEPAG